jgi:hypothetical protein
MERKAAVTTATARRAATTRAPVAKKTTPRTSNQPPASTKAPAPASRPAPAPRRRQASTDVAGPAAPRRPVEHAVLAAEEAVRRTSVRLHVPVLGKLDLPAPEQLAFIGGLAALAAIGLIEWPVAVLLGVGHGLATHAHRKMVRALGEVLEAG